MPVAMVEAVLLARRNERRFEELERRRKKLERHIRQEGQAQEERRRMVYDHALVPFREVFGRLKHVDLAELAPVDPAGSGVSDVELRELRHVAATAVASLAGGAAAGAGVGAVAYAAVGAFAMASTGTAISGLSGAAATSATLAWLGGGSLAAGGGGVAAGTLVMTALVAGPALLAAGVLLEWRGRAVKDEQKKFARRLAEAGRELKKTRAELSAVFQRSRETRLVLMDLGRAMEARQPAFAELVDRCEDYGSYGLGARALVKEMFDLAVATVAVMGAPPAGEDGRVCELSGRVVADARARLSALEAAA
ncbi:hypothetical protein J7F03_28710 [Streptomyces sp. ISL-43]|uniref:hypothetical protein n=1 Tax=Streptomyces sp. ISL-43 TaxID=2819183 RepID=UPI001BE5CA97|nr:hypothetical protein [Streptomyces sp. ISL-43]MBT2450988.1 hypothetical protein [Streptomyces sp. ISL-43]